MFKNMLKGPSILLIYRGKAMGFIWRKKILSANLMRGGGGGLSLKWREKQYPESTICLKKDFVERNSVAKNISNAP